MKNTILICVVLVCICESSELEAASFDGFVVFGDSDLDVGNFCRCSDGLVWAEHLANDIGVPAPTTSNLGGTNYAWAGARTGFGTDTVFGNPVPTIGEQISSYLRTKTPDESKLIVVSAGWNDLVVYRSSPATIVSNTSEHVSALANAGGKHFVVPSLVPPGFAPGIPNINPYDRNADTVNQLLPTELTNLEEQLGVTIHHVDFFDVVDSVVASPRDFGLNNATDSANQNRNRSAEYLFWDDFHFTTAGHRILADAAAAVVPEPTSNLLLFLGLIIMDIISPRRKRS